MTRPADSNVDGLAGTAILIQSIVAQSVDWRPVVCLGQVTDFVQQRR
jgi:hypothetical protein